MSCCMSYLSLEVTIAVILQMSGIALFVITGGTIGDVQNVGAKCYPVGPAHDTSDTMVSHADAAGLRILKALDVKLAKIWCT